MAFFSKSTGLALALGAAVAAPAAAQSIPAEFPPSSFEGNQYVDSEGCAFIRAGIGGATNWVPRVDRSRNQLCSFQPTFAQAPAPEPVPAPAPVAAPVVTAAAPAPAPAPAPRISPVIRNPAAAPVAAAPAPRPAPTPRVIAAAPRPAAPEPRRITFAEACSGRFGVQPGFVSARTGNPIDCGPAPVRTARAVPVATPVLAVDAPLRLTLDQACARIAAGANLVSVDGTPIACPQAAPVQVAAAVPLSFPRGIPASNANACDIPRLAASQGVRCGPQAISPSGQVTRSFGSPATASVSTRTLHAATVSAPSRVLPAPQVPAGYDRVWDDGRLNSQRGLPAPVAVQSHVSTRTVAPADTPVPRATATGHRYVQVGSFADPNNATRLIARLQAAGLPVASGRSGSLKVIAAGPFASASDLSRALGIVRSMGFSDAYTRG